MVAFLGLIIVPERDKHIDIHLAGVVQALTTMESPTLVPMILADMFCALTKCKKGATYFEGCNILLQMWFLEHFYCHDRASRFTGERFNFLSTHLKRVEDSNFSKGIQSWDKKLSALTANQITWNYH